MAIPKVNEHGCPGCGSTQHIGYGAERKCAHCHRPDPEYVEGGSTNPTTNAGQFSNVTCGPMRVFYSGTNWR